MNKTIIFNRCWAMPKQFQFLNEEEGVKALQEFLSNAMFLMEASANWRKFKSSLAKALGKEYQGDLFED